ncbi:hypothetical protein [Prochlorococcus marinus]|uniref:hypothetical protein n=1 Tax=Prochlorococcus marinus TaxID=1219 RepID=UPI0022B511A6|nr:hypothetical protein [Prochlorococcus marinus]
MTIPNLTLLEKEAYDRGLLLRIQVRRPLNIWSFRLVVGEIINKDKIQLLGEMKGWAYQNPKGLQLDTMKVGKNANSKIGDLIWTATMSWALEETPCRSARLLAIYDENNQHKVLQRYFRRRGFNNVRKVGSSPLDLPLRLVWGGAGAFMVGNCETVLERSYRSWLD